MTKKISSTVFIERINEIMERIYSLRNNVCENIPVDPNGKQLTFLPMVYRIKQWTAQDVSDVVIPVNATFFQDGHLLFAYEDYRVFAMAVPLETGLLEIANSPDFNDEVQSLRKDLYSVIKDLSVNMAGSICFEPNDDLSSMKKDGSYFMPVSVYGDGESFCFSTAEGVREGERVSAHEVVLEDLAGLIMTYINEQLD